ncbi:MAG: hypothetical protein PWQ87_122 [Candidatus Woesearchaeota archaeon]|nr:hypothetical protein [Candidatus Woesearchaeota archaeon]
MELLIEKETRRTLLGIFLLSFVLTFLEIPSSLAYNYEHVNVTSKVNVTNAGPEVLEVRPEDSVVLSAGGYKTVTCNATIRDWNGFNDIDNVNATLYYYLNKSSDPDDEDEHYTDSTCVEISNDGQYLANYTCTFDVRYFAKNGTWTCNVSVNDTLSYEDSLAENGSINALYALNVTDVIDYGELSVTDISDNITATLTNLGNMYINVSVLGYGEVEGDGIGLVCEQGSNISVENQRFSSSLVAWDSKIPLASTSQDMGFTIQKPTSEDNPITQNTYWQLYVPPNPFGGCTGIIRFTATAP